MIVNHWLLSQAMLPVLDHLPVFHMLHLNFQDSMILAGTEVRLAGQ